MPMSFPDMPSLVRAAQLHRFRKPNDGEPATQYREALADHVAPIDFIESQEIRIGKGWDQWGGKEKGDTLRRWGCTFA